mgnify:CR=1 FL=1
MTFICSKHFVGGKGPTELHPDPIPATATMAEVSIVRQYVCYYFSIYMCIIIVATQSA